MAATTQRELAVNKDIDSVWNFVSDMSNWASKMPGYQSHEIISDDDSAWTLNVDLGPFQRSIVVDVHVVSWDSPTGVVFNIKGRYEPFTGGGTYRAEPAGTGTMIVLDFSAQPGGSMATMITPLVGPVLERIADQFSSNLAQELDGKVVEGAPAKTKTTTRRGLFKRLAQKIRAWLRSLRAG
ncbi:carbon monoxide dehydrogenase subunit G [Natronocella acetinitrilica]|uniref:Carbon monoxide dehydrogenase subunit G n=1 Tax=Natronocella acetinitrilica TaxID=414046 RepID=A0AAE3GBH7_9GAMM|nr:SRPBCC domain-containing protein [Natronocella acetinitrilica]MCP1677247.1 carbon monoxide dehydrogenase subunit G [Natronocella acetinitrilica]